ncbi:hypothetical protein [Cohnella pontilimi]|nr:hypothetical protein [Cohnella pontilimi]
MEHDLRVKTPEDHDRVKIDIRKILVQLGIDPKRWPGEWSTAHRSTPN